MSGPIAKLQILLGLDSSQVTTGVASANKAVGGFSTGAKAALVGAGAAMGSVGGLALQMGQDYATGSNNIIKLTGASGTALQGLQQSMKNVAGQVPDDLATVGNAVGEVNTRLGLTGPALDQATKGFLDYAHLTGTDVVAATDQVTAAMQRMNVPAAQAPDFLDKLTVAEQATGIHSSDLEDALAKVGPTLQDMGYSTSGSIALLAAWNKAGGDSTQLASGMNKAMAAFAKQGATDAKTAMQDLVAQIKSAPDDMTAAGDAAKIFGTKVGTTMAQQIRSGQLDVDSLTTAIDNSQGSLDNTTEATKTWGDRFQEFFNGIAAQVGPFTGQIGQIGMGLEGLTRIMTPLGGLLGGVAGLFISGFKGLAAKVIPTATVEATAIGAAEGEAESAAATGPSAVTGWLSKFGLMTGEKTAAAAAAGTAEGAAEGAAAGAALGGEEAVGAAGIAGEAVGGGFIAALAPVLAIGAGAAAVAFMPKIIDNLTGQDSGTKLSQLGAQAADVYANGYSDEVKTKYSQVFVDAYNQSLSQAGPFLTQANYDAAGKAAEKVGQAYLNTATPLISQAGYESGQSFMGNFAASTAAQMPAVATSFGFDKGWDVAGLTAAQQTQAAFAHDTGWSTTGDDAANGLTRSFLTGIKDEKSAADQGWTDFVNEMKHPLDSAKEIAKVKGELASKALQDGLNSKDPVIRAQALAEQQSLLGYLADLQKAYGTGSIAASKNLDTGLSTYYGDAKTNAKDFVGSFNSIFDSLKTSYSVGVAITGASKISHLPQFADGGYLPAHTLGLVGEKGPELVRFDSGATIMSDPGSLAGSSLTSAGAGTTINLGGVTINVPAGTPTEMLTYVKQGVLDALKEVAKLRLTAPLNLSGRPI
jgi:TP901 family phage tail tape measure protein